MKVCKGCLVEKELSEYYKKGGLCKLCEREKRLQFHIDNPERAMLWEAKRRAGKKNIPFNIEIEDIKIPENCPILGIKLVSGRGKGLKIQSEQSPTLDKIIPELGYTKGNVRVVSWRANMLKSNGTLDEFRAIVKYLERNENVDSIHA